MGKACMKSSLHSSCHFIHSPFKMGGEVLYSVAQFPSGGTAVVLRSWYRAEEKTLFWPPSKVTLAKAIKDRMQPDEKWTVYTDVRLLTSCGE